MLVGLLKGLVGGRASHARQDLALVQRLVDQGLYEQALDLLHSAAASQDADGKLLYLRGLAQRRLGQLAPARADLEQASVRMPEHVGCLFELAACCRDLGDTARAREVGQRARVLDPAGSRVFGLLAQLELPGEFYFNVLARIQACLRPQTYAEIGVFRGESLRLAETARFAIGIDPNPQVQGELPAQARVVQATSDDYFRTRDLQADLGGQRLDLGFIDGMHRFEFALRDFANLERFCHRGSVLLIHDCYPLDAESAGREPRDAAWSGDVWRLIVLLKKYRPDLHVHTVGTGPTGLGVVHHLDPASTFLLDNHDRLVEEFLALDYSHLDADKAGKLNLFPNDWPAIQTMLAQRPA